MNTCLRESDLQGYLEESGPTPLRQMVEGHLVSCAHCRAAFDRVVATHQRVNAWLSELQSPADNMAVDVTGALARVLSRVEAPDDHLARLLVPAGVEILAVCHRCCKSLHDLIKPEKLPPLMITSRPVAVKSIWGLYDRDPKSRYISVAIHAAAFALLMVGFTSKAVQKKLVETVDLIDPNIKPYIAPAQRRRRRAAAVGGGAREILPVSKGQAPRPSLKQFTPPMIVHEQPKLAMTPTIIAPPDVVLPQE